MFPLSIRLLGRSDIRWDEAPLTIARSQARAMLFRLAAEMQPVSREQLAFLFWPDDSDSTARRKLTQRLSLLRSDLPDPDLIHSSRTHISLDSQRAWSDTADFQRLIDQTKGGQRQKSVQGAIDLYGGSFLNGFTLSRHPEFELWAGERSRYFERLYLDALRELLAAITSRGIYDGAINLAQRYLAVDELAEDVHGRLIQLYAANGDRSAAFRQYEICVTVLERELGVDPLPETQAAYQAVLAGQKPSLQPQAAKLDWQTHHTLDVPFLGREHALDQLQQAYRAAGSGQGQAVFLSGDPGIGKSRLVQDFALRLAEDEAIFLAGASPSSVQSAPYQPIADALRQRLELTQQALDESQQKPSLDDLFPGRISPVWLAEASRLLPELRMLAPKLPPLREEEEPAAARARLYEALVQLLRGFASARQTAVLFLDDIHWADEATLGWLAYLGSKARHSRLLLIVAYCSDETQDLNDFRSGLARQLTITDLSLTGWNSADLRQILDHVPGLATGENGGRQDLAERLQQATGGNPFFALAILHDLAESGPLAQTMAERLHLPLPAEVRKVLLRRLQRLSPASRQVLEAGAVLGRRFSFQELSETAGRGEMATADGLDELLARQFLQEDADADARGDGFRFHHELLRETAYGELSAWRRRLLHRRAAEALLAVHQADLDPISAQLAGQYAQAGLAVEAISAYRRAADVAQRVYAEQKVIAHLQRGLALIASLPGRAEKTTLELDMLIDLASSLYTTKGLAAPETEDAYRQAWTLSQRENVVDAARLLPILFGLYSIHQLRSEFQAARTFAEQYLALAEQAQQQALLPQAYNNLGTVLIQQGEFAQSLAFFEQCIALLEEDQAHLYTTRVRPEPRMFANCFAGHALWHLGYTAQAVQRNLEALALAEALASPYDQAVALCYAAMLRLFRRERGQAQERALAAITLCKKHEFAYYEAWATIIHGWATAAGEEAQAGLERMERGLRDLLATGAALRKPFYLALLAEANGRLGRFEQGLRLLAEGLAWVQEQDEGWPAAELQRMQGELLALQGADSKKISRCFHQAMVIAQRQGAKSLELRAAVSLARYQQDNSSPDERDSAHALLAAVFDWFEEGFDTPDMRDASEMLALNREPEANHD